MFLAGLDRRVLNISNYRQADAAVVVVVVVVDVDVAAGQFLADHADRLPHQAVYGHVTVGRPRSADPFRDAPAVCGSFGQLPKNNDINKLFSPAGIFFVRSFSSFILPKGHIWFKFDFEGYSGPLKFLKSG